MNAINQAEVNSLFDKRLARRGGWLIVRVAPDGARCVMLVQVAAELAPEKAEWLTKTDAQGYRYVAEGATPKVRAKRRS